MKYQDGMSPARVEITADFVQEIADEEISSNAIITIWKFKKMSINAFQLKCVHNYYVVKLVLETFYSGKLVDMLQKNICQKSFRATHQTDVVKICAHTSKWHFDL